MSWKLEYEQEKLTPQQTRVILVRHGQSSFNAEGRYQGSSDESVLTEFGRETARKTGAFLSGLTIDALYVSSLRRAGSTASEILARMNPSIDPANIRVMTLPREVDLLGTDFTIRTYGKILLKITTVGSNIPIDLSWSIRLPSSHLTPSAISTIDRANFGKKHYHIIAAKQ